MTTHDINIPAEEFVVGMEYYYEGSVLMGLRLQLFFGGWSNWVGGRASSSTLSCTLTVHMSEYLPEEELYVEAGQDEVDTPGFPRAYVIGLAGIENVTRVTCPTLIVRKVLSHNIFSYTWVQDGIDNVNEVIAQY